MKKFLKKRILPLVAVLVLLIGAFALPASAYNFSSSEFSNLIVWSYAPETTINDVENYMDMMTLLPNGMWSYDGQGGNKSFGDVVLAEFILPAGTYCISSNIYQYGIDIYLDFEMTAPYYGAFSSSSSSFVLDQSETVRIVLRSGSSSAVNEDLWFMLNAGSDPFPYVLPLNWVYKYDDHHSSSDNYVKGDLVASFTAENGSVYSVSSDLTEGAYYFVEDTLFCAASGPMGDYTAPPTDTVFMASTGREYRVCWLDPSSWGLEATDGSAPDSEFIINIYAATYNVDTDASYTEEDLNQAYQDGFDMGYLDGWADGTSHIEDKYDDMFSGISTGIFSSQKCDIHAFLYTSKKSEPVKFTFIDHNEMSGGIYFNAFWEELNAYLAASDPDWDYVDYVEIVFDWHDSAVFDFNAFPIYISGNSLVESAEITTAEGDIYAASADGSSSELRKFSITSTVKSYPVTVEKFVLHVGRPYDLLREFTLFSNTEMYQEGYASGFVNGTNATASEAFDEGFRGGYSDGYIEGKKEGIELSKGGDWRSLMTAVVEAPVNTFQSLFNFEILGLDMRAAFGSLLSLCVLLIVVKKVLL